MARTSAPSYAAVNNLYQVDTRLLTCSCADYQKHLQACKHLLAVEMHLGALGLATPAPDTTAAADMAAVEEVVTTAVVPAPAVAVHLHRKLAHQRSARLAQHQAQGRPHGAHVDHAGRG